MYYYNTLFFKKQQQQQKATHTTTTQKETTTTMEENYKQTSFVSNRPTAPRPRILDWPVRKYTREDEPAATKGWP